MAKEQKFKLANYDGGLPVYAEAEPSGTLVFPLTGDQGFRWELHWDRKKGFHYGGISRYEFVIEETGPTSCRVSIVDSQDPAIRGSFDLPKTRAAEVDEFIEGRRQLLASSKQRAEKVASGAWWLAATAFNGLGMTKALSVTDTSYLGGWSGHTTTYTGKVTKILVVNSSGIGLKGFKTLFTIPWDQVVDLDVEGPEQASKRVTAGRVLAVGVFALAAKKKTKSAIVLVGLHSGEEAIFQTEKLTAPELKAKLVPIMSQIKRANAPPQEPTTATPLAPAAPLSVADEIKKLGELRESGLITEEEFSAHKAKLLGL